MSHNFLYHLSPVRALSSSSGEGGSSVRARETSDNTGNTTALSEKLQSRLSEMRTLLHHTHYVSLYRFLDYVCIVHINFSCYSTNCLFTGF